MIGTWYSIYPYFFLVSFVLGVPCVLFYKWLAFRFDIVDYPAERKLHTESTPLLGGAAILSAVIIVIIIHYILIRNLEHLGVLAETIPTAVIDGYSSISGKWMKFVIIAFGGICIFFIGLLDDIKGRNPIYRLVGETLVAVVVVSLGVRPGIYDVSHILGFIIAVGWIVGITNAFNLFDGLNGLCSGNAIIVLTIFFIVSRRSNQPVLCILIVCFIGAILSFFVYNFPKGKIFLGSSGSILIGYILSTLVLLQSYGTSFGVGNPLPIVMPVLILSVPVLDTLSVMFIRLRNNQPIMKGDKNHIHHRLVSLRFTEVEAVVIIWALTFAIGINATLLYKSNMLESIIILLQAIAIYCVFIGIIIVRERRLNRRREGHGLLYVHFRDFEKQENILHGMVCSISERGATVLLLDLKAEMMEYNYVDTEMMLNILPNGQSFHGVEPFLKTYGKVVWSESVAVNAVRLGVLFEKELNISKSLLNMMFYLKSPHVYDLKLHD